MAETPALADVHAAQMQKIQILILDVDGVLTTGGITYDDSGREMKTFHVKDGAGVKYWQRVGGRSALLTGRSSPIVEARAKELDIEQVVMGAKNKLPAFDELLLHFGVSAEAVAYVGDDLPDVPPMRKAGFSVAVADAVQEVKDMADAVTLSCGGCGAVREVIEALLKAQGKWDTILQRYFP